MKKLLGFIVSLIMMFLVVGCSDKNTDPLPIIPSGSNSTTDASGGSSDTSSDNNTGTEGDSSSENNNKPSNESDGWSPGCY